MAKAKPPVISSELAELAQSALASSGLTLEDAVKLHIDVLNADQTKSLYTGFKQLPASNSIT